eukprot:CAMPEP_0119119492 /NCGR_PEP_ID=MMETSP1310-20130426/960_1 /TAXON_ID=464262 /ORGANISM="Genus nov. species nov., Strain RCC2339" /LENGTH=1602 /DNA_ID=CAMNT_0007108933 /DNA_START=190 /DNA_END=4998 /DNA_ORIENTATION=+
MFWNGEESTKEPFIVTGDDVFSANGDRIPFGYLNFNATLVFPEVEDAESTGLDAGFDKLVWESTGSCVADRGTRYQCVNDLYFPYITYYDGCGRLLAIQYYIRAPNTNSLRDLQMHNRLAGGIFQHYDPALRDRLNGDMTVTDDDLWETHLAAAGVGGDYTNSVLAITGDESVAFPGHEEVRHVVLWNFFRSTDENVCNCVSGGSFYADSWSYGYHLSSSVADIANFLPNGHLHVPVKYFRNGDFNDPLLIAGWLDTARCVPFMGTHFEQAFFPPFFGPMYSFPTYDYNTAKFSGCELDVLLMQEYGNRAYELDRWGVGGPVNDPSHNDFQPYYFPDFQGTEPQWQGLENWFCNPATWGNPVTGTGFPIPFFNPFPPEVPYVPPRQFDEFSYYSFEQICRNPPTSFPHSQQHMYMFSPGMDPNPFNICPAPLFTPQAPTNPFGTDYTWRPIDGFRSPDFGIGQRGTIFDGYLRYTASVLDPVDLPGAGLLFDGASYFGHWTFGHLSQISECEQWSIANGRGAILGGGERQQGVLIKPWTFGDPALYCQMIQTTYDPFISDMFAIPQMPNPRLVSNVLFDRIPEPDSDKFLNMLHVYFGMTVTFDTCAQGLDLFDPIYTFIDQCDRWNDPKCQCCSPEDQLDLNNFGRCSANGCIQFNLRTAPSPGILAVAFWFLHIPPNPLIPRTSINYQTSFLDMSHIYTASAPYAEADVRNQTHRQYLRIDEITKNNLWFQFGNRLPALNSYGGTQRDFIAARSGDVRYNKNPAAHAVMDIFIRNHNRLANICMNGGIGCLDFLPDESDPSYNDLVFNMARRWNIAQYQRIVFREYLAATLGVPLDPFDRNADGLAFTRNLDAYNRTNDPRVSVEFSQSAYRVSHIKILNHMERRDRFLDEVSAPMMVRDLYNMTYFYDTDSNSRLDGVLEELLYGMVTQLQPKADARAHDGIRNLMGFSPGGTFDLVSTNIARGRDQGLPPFNDIRQAYGLTRYNRCSDLQDDNWTQRRLVDLYGSDNITSGFNESSCISRIDPYVAMLVERKSRPQSTLGDTAWQVTFEQFSRWRSSDRYYYEHQLSSQVASELGLENNFLSANSYNGFPFTDEEIEAIYSSSFEELIAANSNIDLGELGANLFFVRNRQLFTLTIDGSLISGEIQNPSQFEYSRQLSDQVTLWWRIEDGDDYITIRYQTLTSGWLGFGVEPELNTMRGADIYFCRVYGEDDFELTDRFALDVGPPRNDTDIGGEDNVIRIGNLAAAAEEVDGSTICQFTRPLNSGDDFDKVIDRGLTKIMFAFNPFTDDEVYHGPTRDTNIYINFFFTYPVREVELAIIILIGIFAALGIFYCIFTLIVIFLKEEYFRFMSPLFCQLIVIGAIIAFGSCFTLMEDAPSEASCTIYPWLLGIGYTLAFACLFAKTWRLWRLFARKSLKAKVIDNMFLLQIVAVFMVIMIIYLIIWTAVDGVDTRREFVDNDNDEVQILCDSEDYWWGIFVGMIGAGLLVGCVLSFLIRNIPQEYNDAEAIAMSIYNATLMLAAGAAIGWGLDDEPSAVVAAKGFSVLIAFWFLVLILFAPTHYRIFVSGAEPQTFKSTMAMGSGGSGVSGLTSGSTTN